MLCLPVTRYMTESLYSNQHFVIRCHQMKALICSFVFSGIEGFPIISDPVRLLFKLWDGRRVERDRRPCSAQKLL